MQEKTVAFLAVRWYNVGVKKKEKKQPDWDDGRVIAPMNGDELPQYRRAAFSNRPSKANNQSEVDLTKKEKRALMRGLFLAMLPRLLVVLASFAIVALLLFLWLM